MNRSFNTIFLDTSDYLILLRELDQKQQKTLTLFKEYNVVTNAQLAHILGITTRSSALLCKKWVQKGFLKVVDPSYKARTYSLAQPYNQLA